MLEVPASESCHHYYFEQDKDAGKAHERTGCISHFALVDTLLGKHGEGVKAVDKTECKEDAASCDDLVLELLEFEKDQVPDLRSGVF